MKTYSPSTNTRWTSIRVTVRCWASVPMPATRTTSSTTPAGPAIRDERSARQLRARSRIRRGPSARRSPAAATVRITMHEGEQERVAERARVDGQAGLERHAGRSEYVSRRARRPGGSPGRRSRLRRDRSAAAAARSSATLRRSDRPAAPRPCRRAAPLRTKAAAITRLARTPISRAVSKSSAAARICTPRRVRLRNSISRPPEQRSSPPSVITLMRAIRTSPIAIASVSPSPSDPARAFAPKSRIARFWST